MNTNTSIRQFVKDGLVGVAVVLILFVPIAAWVFQESPFSVFFDKRYMSEIFFDLSHLAPMPFVIMMAFIGVGIGGRYLETTLVSRKEWGVAIRKIVGVSWLAGVGLSVVYGVFFVFTSTEELAEQHLDTIGVLGSFISIVLEFMLAGGLGAFFGFIIGSVTGIIFKPHKRLYRIIIGAFSSALVGYGVLSVIQVFRMLGSG